MPVANADIEAIFEEIADLLEIKGDNPFRVRAYRNAARVIASLGCSVAEMVREGEDLSKLKGIGKDLAQKIEEIVKTGKLKKHEVLKKSMPVHILKLLTIEGLGPKRVLTLYRELGAMGLEDLKRAARSGKIRQIEGFGPKLEEAILEGLKLAKKEGKRFKYAAIEEYAFALVSYLEKTEGIRAVEVAGSFRRKKETVGDLDLLVSTFSGKEAIENFVKYEDIQSVLSRGTTRSTVILKSGLQVDLRAVAPESYGAALHYLTGSKAHNIAVRKIGQKMGFKINEYGVFKGRKKIAGATEEEVYRAVGLPYIEPELRENQGEIEAAEEGRLPRLIEVGQIRGDLHLHSSYTDGQNRIEELAVAAKQRGYEYIAITDHSKRLTVAHGLDEKRLKEQIEEIDRLNEKMTGITILKGIEVDILEDGSLDLADEILKELDVVVAAVHYKFNLSETKQTERILRALNNPYVHILAHPTGRLIGERPPYLVNVAALLKGCLERGCFMELNAMPERLDLNDIHCKMAKEMGVKLSISTDAHSVLNLAFIQYGINQARRGWIEADDVINTRPLSELRRLLKR